MPRLFIALSVPDAAERALREICYCVPGARFTPSGHFHLTLRFMGELDAKAFSDLRDALYDIRNEPFNLFVQGVGSFPLRGTPRTLWVGASVSGVAPRSFASDPLIRLQRNVEKRVVALGHKPDDRKFHPHVTIARLSEGRGMSERVAQFLAANSLWRAEPFTVNVFHLYSSRMKSDGPHYQIEQTYPLYEPISVPS